MRCAHAVSLARCPGESRTDVPHRSCRTPDQVPARRRLGAPPAGTRPHTGRRAGARPRLRRRGMAPARPDHTTGCALRGRGHLRDRPRALGRRGTRPRRPRPPRPASPKRRRVRVRAAVRRCAQLRGRARLRRLPPHPCRGPRAPGSRRRVLIGDGFWEGPPSQEAVEMLGNFTDLATPWTVSSPTAGLPLTATSARARSWTTTSGPAGARWPPGPSITLTTPTPRRCSRRPRPGAPNGCVSTGTPSASSPWFCAGHPTALEPARAPRMSN